MIAGAGVALNLFRRLVTGPSHDLHFTVPGVGEPGASRLAKAVSGARNAAALVVPGPDGSSLATLCKSLQFSDTNDLMLKVCNDQNGGLASESAPTTESIRYIATNKQLRLKRDDGAALLLLQHLASGPVAAFRRSGVVTGSIGAYVGRTQYGLPPDSVITGGVGSRKGLSTYALALITFAQTAQRARPAIQSSPVQEPETPAGQPYSRGASH